MNFCPYCCSVSSCIYENYEHYFIICLICIYVWLLDIAEAKKSTHISILWLLHWNIIFEYFNGNEISNEIIHNIETEKKSTCFSPINLITHSLFLFVTVQRRLEYLSFLELNFYSKLYIIISIIVDFLFRRIFFPNRKESYFRCSSFLYEKIRFHWEFFTSKFEIISSWKPMNFEKKTSICKLINWCFYAKQ